MESVVLVIHLILAFAIIALVLLQRSEGGGLGIGGGSGGLGGFASARGTANALTKMTALCAAGFFITSLTLGVIASHKHNISQGILEDVDEAEIHAPVADDDEVVAPTATYEPPETNDIPEVNIEEEASQESEKEIPDAPAVENTAAEPADAAVEEPQTEEQKTEKSQGVKPTE